MEVRRLYIGGLFPKVTEADLKDRFSKFGEVDNVEIKIREQMEGTPVKTFAYINLTAEEQDIKRCIKTFDKTKWKGSELKIQMAKENFLSRLIKERTNPEEKDKMSDGEKGTSPTKPVEREVKGPPGTKVPGEENWVVGKYGRVLPVVNIKKDGSRNIKKIDPSKFVHNVKKLDKDNKSLADDTIKLDELTWQLDVNDNELTRKRKGEFADFKPKHKHRKSLEYDGSNDNWANNDNHISNSSDIDSSIGNESSDKPLNEGRKTPRVKNHLVEIKHTSNLEYLSKDQLNENKINKSPKQRKSHNDSKTNSGKKSRKMSQSSDLSDNVESTKFVSKQQKPLNTMPSHTSERDLEESVEVKSPLEFDRTSQDNDESEDSDFWQNNYKHSKSPQVASPLQTDKLNDTEQLTIPEDTGFEVVDPDKVTSYMRTKTGNDSLDLKRFDSDCSDDDANKSMSFLRNENNERGNTQHRHKNYKTSKREQNVKKSLVTLKRFKGTKMLKESVDTKNLSKDSDEKESEFGQSITSNMRKPSKKESVSGSKLNLSKNKNVNVGIFDTLNEFASGFTAEQILSRSISDDDDVDNDLLDNINENKHERLLAPRSDTKGESVNGNVNLFQFKKESSCKVVVKHLNADPISQKSSSSDSDSSSESDMEETPNNEMKVTPKVHENSSSDSGESEMEETPSNKMKANTGVHEKFNSEKPIVHESSSSDSESSGESKVDETPKYEIKVRSSVDKITKSNKPTVQESSSSDSESSGESKIDETPKIEIKAKSSVHKMSKSNKPIVNESSSSDSETSGDSDQETDSKLYVSKQTPQNELVPEHNSSSHNEDTGKHQALEMSVVQNDSSDSDSSEIVEEEIASKKSSSSPKSKTISQSEYKPLNEAKKITLKGKQHDDKISQNKILDTEKWPNNNTLKQSLSPKNDKSLEISKTVESKNTLKTENELISFDDRKKVTESSDKSTDKNKVKIEGTHSTLNENGKVLKSNDVQKNKAETEQTGKSHTSNTEEVEQRRLAAVKQKYKDNLKQAATVQHALSNANQGQKLNKKVVFEDDSDLENTETAYKSMQNGIKNGDEEEVGNESDDGDNDGISEKETVKTKTSLKKVSMAESSTSSSDDESDDESDDDDNDDGHESDDVHKSIEQTDKQISEEEKKLTLFDSSSSSDDDGDEAGNKDDDDDESDDETRFAVRPQFEGSSGAKLLELQASYGNDKRFHLDERFAESDSEEEDKDEGEDDKSDEKQNALKILESIVGFKVTTEKTDKKQSNFKDISSLHYDPTREEHKEFELSKEHKSTKKGKKSEEETDSNKENPEDDEASKKMQERFFEVSDTFKKSLTTEPNTEGAQTFSLLQAFGAKDSDVEEEENKDTEEANQDKLPLDVRFLRRPDKDFDDDKVEMDTTDDSQISIKGSSKTSGPLKGKEDKRTFFFFFKDEDERMKANTQFYRTEDLDVIREQWKKEKQAHIQRFKLKAKNFSRKKIQPGHDKHGDIFERRKIDQRLKSLHSRRK